MTTRYYRDYYPLRSAAVDIIVECIECCGRSSGWAGSGEELEEVEKICNKYNVYYVNDFYGTWALVEKERQ